jgi:WD40 repeat protein
MNGLVRGGLLTKRPLLLAEDGEVFLCVCDNDIRVYSARTGLLLSTMRGHTAEVTALAHHPLNSRQVRALAPTAVQPATNRPPHSSPLSATWCCIQQ